MSLFQPVQYAATISGYANVPRNDEESLLKALSNQPVSVAIDASGIDFQLYSGVRMSINNLRN